MHRWQLQEAKQRLSELLREAQTHGPQIITRHGEDAAVVLSLADFSRLRGEPDLKEFLASAPDFQQLELTRSREVAAVRDL